MCGIAGIISNNKRDVISKMTEVLVHRGPDEDGYYHDDTISLGQRRLSIIDLDSGKQPCPQGGRRHQPDQPGRVRTESHAPVQP